MMQPINTIADFHERYEPITETGCWIWMGTTYTEKGYERGRFSLNGRTFATHRLAYTIFKGEIPDGMQVNHHCDVPLCVNPDHLYAGTQHDNMRDRCRRGRVFIARGDANSRSKLNDVIVSEILVSSETHRALAARYGVSYQMIGRIKRRECWTHVATPVIYLSPPGRQKCRHTGI